MNKRLLILGLVFSILGVLGSNNAHAGLNFFGNYGIAEQQDGTFLQSYNHSTRLTFDQDLNSSSTLSENLRYSEEWRDGGNRKETVVPSLRYGLSNELFDLNLNGDQVSEYNTKSNNETKRSWDSQMNSRWSKAYVPDLYVSYGQTFSEDTEDPHILDTQSDTANGTVDWNLDLVRFFYGVNWSKNKNKLNGFSNTITSQLAQASTGFSLWENRMRFTLAHKYTLDTNERPTVTVNGKYFLQQTGITVRALQDPVPDPANLLFTSMLDIAGLYDTVKNVSAMTIALNEKNWNIALDLGLQETDALFVYFDPATTVVAGDLSNWQVWSSDDGITWTTVSMTTAVQFDAANSRFIIQFEDQLQPPTVPATKRYVKIVVDSPSITANPVNITEVEAYRIVNTVEDRSKTTREKNQTIVGMQFKIVDALSMAYNFSLFTADNDPEEPRTSDSTTHSGTLTYKPIDEFITKVNVSDYVSKVEGHADIENRAYGLDFLTVPLQTVDMRLGISRSESYENDIKQTINDYYELNTDAKLYPDLDSHMRLDYQEVEDVLTTTKTKTYSALLDFGATLNPKVTANFSGKYSDVKASTETERFLGVAGLGWRLSDSLSITMSGSKTWIDWHGELESIGTSLVLSPTAKVQINMTYAATVEDSVTTNSASSSVRWTIMKNLFLNANTRYTNSRVDEEIFLIDGTVSFRFSAL